MKLIALITTFLLSFSAVADTGAQLAFEKSLNEYHYALTTEWDQKDDVALALIHDSFEKEVKSLLHLTNEDIFSVLERKSISKSHMESLKLRLSLAQDSEFSVLKDELKRSFHQGASWNGQTTLAIASVVLLFGGLIAFAIASTDQGECIEMAEYIDCDNSGNDCYPVTRCKTYSR